MVSFVYNAVFIQIIYVVTTRIRLYSLIVFLVADEIIFIYLDLMFSGTLSRGYTVSNSDRSLSSTSVRDYDGLKQQCDKAMHELQMLRRYVYQSY
jgi:hypothetical protein